MFLLPSLCCMSYIRQAGAQHAILSVTAADKVSVCTCLMWGLHVVCILNFEHVAHAYADSCWKMCLKAVWVLGLMTPPCIFLKKALYACFLEKHKSISESQVHSQCASTLVELHKCFHTLCGRSLCSSSHPIQQLKMATRVWHLSCFCMTYLRSWWLHLCMGIEREDHAASGMPQPQKCTVKLNLDDITVVIIASWVKVYACMPADVDSTAARLQQQLCSKHYCCRQCLCTRSECMSV